MTEETKEQHLVLYTDGGAWPVNPGFGGWGIHGYRYEKETPKKGSGSGKWILTQTGYVDKTLPANAEATIVSPIQYIDGYGSYPELVSNNNAELDSTIYALQHALALPIKSFHMESDSQYVVHGITKDWVNKWERNQWRLANGNPVANVEQWKQVRELIGQLTEAGVTFTCNWIRSHQNHLGNDRADHLANLGENYSYQDKKLNRTFVLSEPDGYWKSDVERHPFLNLPYCLITTDQSRWVKNKYYQVTTAKEVDQIGRRARDGSFAIVELNEPSMVIDTVMKAHADMDQGIHAIIAIDNNQIHRGLIHDYITTYGKYALRRKKPHRHDLETLDKTLISYQQEPALLSYRAIDKLEEYNVLFECVKSNQFVMDEMTLVETDLTDVLYETKTKVKKGKPDETVMTLKAEYKVGFTKLNVAAKYDHNGEIRELPLTLLMGIDMLDRNSLKRLETHLPKITLITWAMDDTLFNYATVIRTADSLGVWAGVFTNQRIIPADEQ